MGHGDELATGWYGLASDGLEGTVVYWFCICQVTASRAPCSDHASLFTCCYNSEAIQHHSR
jgi:hypothetical protein